MSTEGQQRLGGLDAEQLSELQVRMMGKGVAVFFVEWVYVLDARKKKKHTQQTQLLSCFVVLLFR